MEHTDHVALLREGIPAAGGTWADFGAGRGAFTLALAELIGPQGGIFAIDKDRFALQVNERSYRHFFENRSAASIEYMAADFTQKLRLPPLDGIVMANSLHFQRQKDHALVRVLSCLKPGGRLVLVEYNVDRGNPWVPYPLSYPTWEILAIKAGFCQVRLLYRRPSSFLKEIYSSLAIKQAP
jgi:ubiquinone/menaquinone biosynthesis C-methylase UbiE